MDGPFRLQERIATGGMGEVWAAVHAPTGLPVAVKALPTLESPALRSAFADEVRAVARLDHPHVVRVFDHGEAGAGGPLPAGAPWLAMERAHGELRVSSGAELCRALQELLSALACAHARGVLHRDVKASNLLMREDGGVLLADFGIARLGASSMDGAGTLGAMAPEQLRGRGDRQGPWTDLYAVGCLAWQVATGAPLFGEQASMRDHLHRAPPRLDPVLDLPAGFDRWVLRLLEKDPAHRPECAADAAAGLADIAGCWTLRPRGDRPDLRGVGASLVALRPPPLVGREALLAELDDAMTELPAAVVLQGPSGIGKTRLAQELTWAAEEAGAASCVFARYGPQGDEHGVAAALARALGGLGLDHELRRRGAPPRDTAALSALLEDPAAFGEAAARRAALAGALTALAERRPLILVLDDAQWAHADLELCEELLGRSAPILVLLTVQDEALCQEAEARSLLDRLPGRRVRLPPVPAEALARAVLGLDDAAAVELAERAAGNPLMAVQLVTDWATRLLPGDTGFRLPGGRPLPANLDALWGERLDRVLGDRDRSSLEVAAAGGLRVEDARWQQVCAEARLAVDHAGLQSLLRAGLAVREPEQSEWRFVHGMVREALGEQARRGDRWQESNRAWARVLEREGGSPGHIGHHRLEAGEPERALGPLLDEVQRLWRQGEFPRVARALDQWTAAALEAGVPPDCWLRGRPELWRCRLALLRQGVDAAAERLEALGAHAEGWGLYEALSLQRCHHAWMRGQLEVALEHARAASRTEDPQLAREAGRDEGRLLAILGRPHQARASLKRTLQSAEEAGDDFVACVCLDGLAEAAWVAGDLDAVRDHGVRQAALCAARGFRVWGVGALYWPAVADLKEGRYARACDALQVWQRRCRELGQPTCHQAGALVLAQVGRGGDGSAALKEATEEAAALGWQDTETTLRALRVTLVAAGDRRDWEEALAAGEGSGDPLLLIALDLAMGRCTPPGRAEEARALRDRLAAALQP